MNGGIRPSGLFWTVQIPDHSFWISGDRRKARLRLRDVCLIDTFQFAAVYDSPALVSCDVKWCATGKSEKQGLGLKAGDDLSQAFEGDLAVADADGWFAGWGMGYDFKGHAKTNPQGFAEMGTERNGLMLGGGKMDAPAKAPPAKEKVK